jgi:broad specificity phosphatase PhoE
MFVRHGETVGNKDKIAHGQTESPLTQLGISQARLTAEMLTSWETKYHRIYASPLSRAFDTGTHIANALNLPIHTHEGLMEGFLGDWEGITYAQLDEVGFARKSIRDHHFDGHNGESPQQLSLRMTATISGIQDEHSDENIIIVSHGAAIAHALSNLLQTKPVFGHQYIMNNSAVTEVAIDAMKFEMMKFNVNDHLPEDLKIDRIRNNRKD